MATAYLGLGSNLGDRAGNIAKAVALLQDKGIALLKMSMINETDPVGGPPQGKFLNAVVKVETNFSAQELLSRCQNVEKQLGRVRGAVCGPRTMDIDILLYDQLRMNTPSLVIPHPRMRERAFVMDPLREIEPHLFKESAHAGHPLH